MRSNSSALVYADMTWYASSAAGPSMPGGTSRGEANPLDPMRND
jgi:hypothetical protein